MITTLVMCSELNGVVADVGVVNCDPTSGVVTSQVTGTPEQGAGVFLGEVNSKVYAADGSGRQLSQKDGHEFVESLAATRSSGYYWWEDRTPPQYRDMRAPVPARGNRRSLFSVLRGGSQYGLVS